MKGCQVWSRCMRIYRTCWLHGLSPLMGGCPVGMKARESQPTCVGSAAAAVLPWMAIPHMEKEIPPNPPY